MDLDNLTFFFCHLQGAFWYHCNLIVAVVGVVFLLFRNTVARAYRWGQRWCRWSCKSASPRVCLSVGKEKCGWIQMKLVRSPWRTPVRLVCFPCWLIAHWVGAVWICGWGIYLLGSEYVWCLLWFLKFLFGSAFSCDLDIKWAVVICL